MENLSFTDRHGSHFVPNNPTPQGQPYESELAEEMVYFLQTEVGKIVSGHKRVPVQVYYNKSRFPVVAITYHNRQAVLCKAPEIGGPKDDDMYNYFEAEIRMLHGSQFHKIDWSKLNPGQAVKLQYDSEYKNGIACKVSFTVAIIDSKYVITTIAVSFDFSIELKNLHSGDQRLFIKLITSPKTKTKKAEFYTMLEVDSLEDGENVIRQFFTEKDEYGILRWVLDVVNIVKPNSLSQTAKISNL
jgi:hypothetical protein